MSQSRVSCPAQAGHLIAQSIGNSRFVGNSKQHRIARPRDNVAGEMHAGIGDVPAGFETADEVYEATFRMPRVCGAAVHGAGNRPRTTR